jgi:hypothetical protein
MGFAVHRGTHRGVDGRSDERPDIRRPLAGANGRTTDSESHPPQRQNPRPGECAKGSRAVRETSLGTVDRDHPGIRCAQAAHHDAPPVPRTNDRRRMATVSVDPRSTSFELPGADGLSITIDIPAIADVDDEDEKLIVENSVHDPVVANSDSVRVVAGQFNRSRAARIRSECFDSPNDPTIKFTRKFSKRPGGGGRVFDLVRYDQIPNWRLSVS